MVFIRTEEKIWSWSHKDKKQGLTNAIRREDNILSNSIMTGKSILPEAMRAGGRSLTWSQNERKAFYLKPWGQEHRFSATQIPPFRHSKLQSPTRRKNQDGREIKISLKTRRWKREKMWECEGRGGRVYWSLHICMYMYKAKMYELNFDGVDLWRWLLTS